MGREKKIEVGALNIKTHPHSPEQYAQLFKDVYEMGFRGKVRGSYFGIIGEMHAISGELADGIEGFFYRFMNLDPNEPWLNLAERKVLEKDDDGAPKIPDHIKPHLRMIPFVFFPKQHRLIFDKKSISPGGLQKLLQTMFSAGVVLKKYGEVDVIVEASQETIERILQIPRKTKLIIKISKPNPDEGSDAEARVLRKMGAQNADKLEQVLISKSKEGLQPDDDTKVLMRTARSNGVVIAEGRNAVGEKVEESTKSHPFRFPGAYDPQDMTLLEAVRQLAFVAIRSLME